MVIVIVAFYHTDEMNSRARGLGVSEHNIQYLADETDSRWVITYTHRLGWEDSVFTKSVPEGCAWEQHEPPGAWEGFAVSRE